MNIHELIFDLMLTLTFHDKFFSCQMCFNLFLTAPTVQQKTENK